NGMQAEAKVLGADPNSDLAVVRVDKLPNGVHPLPLGDSDKVQVGEWVVAIGNPFEERGTMTVGIVSAIGRTIPSGATQFDIPNAIQTDAAINPGNSGGPLINMNGQVIGVNSQIETGGTTNASAGVGFAIPSNVVRKVAPALIGQGSIQWPWLGVIGTPLTLNIAQANNLSIQQGAYIDQVVANGPANKAGLKGSSGQSGNLGIPTGGDVVIAADGKPILSFDDLLIYIMNKNPGDKVQLTILRNGKQQEVSLTLEPRPANLPQQPQQPQQSP
ncbi:MAG TPA: trypsin-like peptidase domain-containing protein, partial [Anaerolineales bacterium]